MSDDELIREYHLAFRKYSKEGVIDMDNKLKVKFNFQVHRAANYVNTLDGIIPAFRQTQYFVILITSGEANKSVGHFTFPAHHGTLYIIPSRVIHSTKNISSDFDGYMLSFNLEFFLQNEFPKHHIIRRKIFKNSIRPYIELNDAELLRAAQIFEFILAEHAMYSADREEIIAVKTLELLMTCDRLFTSAHAIGKTNIYCSTNEKFNELLGRCYKKHRNVTYYAEAMNMHPNALNQKIKNHTGLTAKETITNYILLEAKALLVSTELSIKEIAFELGFNHPEHFYSLFKKNEKLSPAQYRLNIH